MKKKVFNRPVSVLLSDEMYDQIKAITDKGEVSLSDYIRDAIQDKLDSKTSHTKIQSIIRRN